MKYKFLILGLSILFGSCQKVINIDLKNKDATIVIEGTVTDSPTIPHTVKITKSVNFSADNVFPAVSGANVTISDNAGNTVTLNETSPGIYQNSTLVGTQGRTYYLNVIAEGKTYSAASTIPTKVNLDTVLVDVGLSPPGAGNGNSKSAIPVFTDPYGKGNNYKFFLKKNNILSKQLFITDDQIVDGGINNRPLSDSDFEYKTNDTITVTMMCLDKAVYLYFYSLSQSGSGPDASATPANPVTNINGAILGYFSAHTIQTKKVIVP
jgi:hypothetical protein